MSTPWPTYLSVPPCAKFVCQVHCDLPFRSRLPQAAPEWALDGRWQQLLSVALTHDFTCLGFGAKTAVRYGAMREAALPRRESYKFSDWSGKKERKREVKQWLTQLDGSA